jgi:endonuclease/exonuclease/phosphatase family metal-dependent hydrolase
VLLLLVDTMLFVRTSAVLVGAFVVATHVVARVSRASSDTLTVMTFNIQHGITGSGKYDLQRAIAVIAKVQPDLVGLQEVTRNHPYYNCDDQPAKLAEGLKTLTGHTWSVAYEQEWFTPSVECQQSGRGDGKETEGLAFLAPAESIGATKMTSLPASRIAVAVRAPSVHGVTVVVTHLASGKQGAATRQKQVAALLPWAQKVGAPRVLIGDFNMKIDKEEIQPVTAEYRDAWDAGEQASVASGTAATHGENRIDFIFYQPDGLQLERVETIDTRTLFGSAASDHRPLVATFRVRPRS